MTSILAYEELIGSCALQLSKGGVFLMTGLAEKNPMTIGWCQWGRIWNIPICTVLVRPSRHSHRLIERDGLFTVSVPGEGAMKKELGYCGTHSGRDVNKLIECNLATIPAQAGGIDALLGCSIHFECRVLFKLEMAGNLPLLAGEQRAQFYTVEEQAGGDGDPHTVYYGRILAAYKEPEA
ncbi:MAG TPA: flavin reductase [Clostridia bacterium]|mgnify:FL=1|nr:flavin reductase [Clostridia bacterium]